MSKKSELKKLLKSKLILVSLLATSAGVTLTGCPNPENNDQVSSSTETSTAREYTPSELEKLKEEQIKCKEEEQENVSDLIKFNEQMQEEYSKYYSYEGNKLTKEEYQKILINNPATGSEIEENSYSFK